jgi:chromosome segregation ATPase
MRGRRFGRPLPKKSSAKDKRETKESTAFYEQVTPVTPDEIRFSTLNSLEHLGKQRFALPPYSEHFNRWMKDVRAVLVEFESRLPEVVNKQYNERVENTLNSLQISLNELTGAENKVSEESAETQRKLSTCESELSRLEHDYKTATSQLRRHHEQSFEKLRREIDTLDKQRLRIIHTKPTLLQRLLRKPDTKLSEKTSTLQSKKNALGDQKESLKQDLEKYRNDYEQRRKQTVQKLEELRARMVEARRETFDDALELRSRTCSKLSEVVRAAMDQPQKEQGSQNVDGTRESSVVQQ